MRPAAVRWRLAAERCASSVASGLRGAGPGRTWQPACDCNMILEIEAGLHGLKQATVAFTRQWCSGWRHAQGAQGQ